MKQLAWSFLLLPAMGIGIGLLYQPAARPAPAAAEEFPAPSGFKITFGLRMKTHGRVWAGGVRDAAQVRSIRGWHLDAQDSIIAPNRWNITLSSVGGDVAAKGVILDLLSPEQQPVTIFVRDGDFTFVPAEIPYGKPVSLDRFKGDVSIERVPVPQAVTGPGFEDDDPVMLRTRSGEYWLAWVAYKTRKRDGYRYTGADQVMVARGRDGWRWQESTSITGPGDHFRVALGEDSRGHVWCVYGAQKKMETGNFDLHAKVFDGSGWSGEQQLTTSPYPDAFHRMAADQGGNLYLVWAGFRPGPGGTAPQSDILMRVHSSGRWSEEINLSQSPEDEWEPAVAAGASGRAWIAWDSYRAAGGGPATYDLMLRSYSKEAGPGPLTTVSATPFAEMRADLAVDGRGRLWVAWEEGGVNWGKDSGYENPKHGIHLRPGGSLIYGQPNSLKALYRRPRVAVLEDGQWKQPAAALNQAYPETLQGNLYQSPRLGVDGGGHAWLFLRHQLVARGRNGGLMFDYYATSLSGGGAAQRWLPLIPLPASTGRQDTLLATAPAPGGLAVTVAGDGRRFPVPLPVNNDVASMVIGTSGLAATDPVLAPFQASAAGNVAVTHPGESGQVEAIRRHRVTVGGQAYKIVRGDVHRHTEISMDGAIDGSLWDAYRYAVNAAAFDYVAVTDHNYGAWLDTDEPESRNTDDEYQWWRTQKSADLYHVPGRFVGLYGYERSVNFPLGHRNIIHARRGIFSYRVPKLHIAERPELVDKDAQGLWDYLRGTGGIGIPHTSGTVMGTDWRLRDDELEPVTEIYQGDRNAYEEEGQPRAALPEAPGDGAAGRQPFQKGLIWNALGVGYRMGFIASSDHFSTHISYANLLVPDRMTTRDDIQEAFRLRRTYAATDNIVLDFHTGGVMQGGALRAGESPVFHIKVLGTEPILRVELVKNNRVVYSRPGDPGSPRAEFTFRDNEKFADTSMAATSQIRNWERPETGIRARPPGKSAYYYVRVIQRFSSAQPDTPGEVAWASPIFVEQ